MMLEVEDLAKRLAGIEEGDGLPPNICEECLAMVEQTYLFKKKCKASDSKLREHLELLELNEEGKLNEINFIDVSEDHKHFFTKEYPSESKCDESSAVDSGGTDIQPEDTTNSIVTGEEAKETELKSEPQNQRKKEENESSEDEEESPEDVNEPQNKVIKKVQRYILKGEIREGEQEEDLTVCEVIPLDTRNDLESSDHTDNAFSDQNGHLVNQSNSVLSEKEGRIQEIYQLWDNEDEVGEENENAVSEEKNHGSCKTEKVVIEDDKEDNVVFITVTNEKKETERVGAIKMFQCPHCIENYARLIELRQHIAVVHKEFSDAEYCDICCKSFTCANSLKRHKLVHTGIRPYKCKVCGRDFSQGSILKRHLLTHDRLKPFTCHLCNKGYTQKRNLLFHLKNHGFQTVVENYKCHVCPKTFAHQSGLSRHIQTHKGYKFLCGYCKKIFADSSALSRHVKVIHQNGNKIN